MIKSSYLKYLILSNFFILTLKGIKPNFDCLELTKDSISLQKQLAVLIEKVDIKSIQFDLEALIDNKDFVTRISKEIKDILKRNIEKIL